MKKRLSILAAMLLMAGGAIAQSVNPINVAITNRTTDTVAAISTQTFCAGTSILFTNCVFLSTTGTVLPLSGVSVSLKIGTFQASDSYTGTVNAASSNWWALARVPATLNDRETCYVQVTRTDGTNYVVYPLKTVNFTQGL